MISLLHVLSISNADFCFLRFGKSHIFLPIWIKSSLRVSEDRGVIDFRMDSVYSSVVFVTLRRFATAEIILS